MMADIATAIESIASRQRELLAVGGTPEQFAEQVDHLESIAESLRVACDPEASALLIAAVEGTAT